MMTTPAKKNTAAVHRLKLKQSTSATWLDAGRHLREDEEQAAREEPAQCPTESERILSLRFDWVVTLERSLFERPPAKLEACL